MSTFSQSEYYEEVTKIPYLMYLDVIPRFVPGEPQHEQESFNGDYVPADKGSWSTRLTSIPDHSELWLIQRRMRKRLSFDN